MAKAGLTGLLQRYLASKCFLNIEHIFFANGLAVSVSAVRSDQRSARHCAVPPFQPGELTITHFTSENKRKQHLNQSVKTKTPFTYLICVLPVGGADEQHRAGAELPAADY